MKELSQIFNSILLSLSVFITCVSAEENVKILNDIPDSLITAPLPKDYRVAPPPTPGDGIRKYALDSMGLTAGNFGTIPFDDNMLFATFRADRLEYQNYKSSQNLLWDVTSWVGNDYDKLYFESEGKQVLDGKTEAAETRLFYSRNISSFWDVQVGGQYDITTPERYFGMIGLLGYAPLWFNIESQLYFSNEADISASIEAEYDIILTQRLFLQPRAALKAAVQEVPQYDIGSGLNQFEMGLRLRYMFTRKFAPYSGVSWVRKVGEAAHFANSNGDEESKLFWVTGVKLWF